MSDDKLTEISKRLERLEKAVFGKTRKRPQEQGTPAFSGATGGIRLLISKNFFNAKRKLGEVRDALAENGYHYSRQAVQMALKGLATRKGPLALLKEGGTNLYVNRK